MGPDNAEKAVQAVLVEAVQAAFQNLVRGYTREPDPSVAVRRDRLRRLEALVEDHADDFADAVDADFGGRSRHETLLAEILTVLDASRLARRHLPDWMAPQAVTPSPFFRPSRAFVQPVPLGVVGIIAPWNYPVDLALGPLVGVLAAGNRALIKPSELTPRVARLLAETLRDRFSAEELAVVQGGPEVAQAVTALPLHHLVFTGSTAVGRQVALAAADHLLPTTLELGGKCPALIHPDHKIALAADRIAVGKLFNAGQTCVAPDYALVREDQVEAFAGAFRAVVSRLYPRLADNPDYTSIVSERHYRRLVGLVDEAKTKGARVIEVNPAGETLDPAARKLAPTLVIGAADDAAILQDEIFGPLLPIVAYRRLEDAIEYVNARPRPLALYYFDRDGDRTRKVLSQTTSGGACVNDTLLHVGQDDLPFGGVGPSGMGSYHGPEGFFTFTHKKAVFFQARLNSGALLSPPYGSTIDRLMNLLVGKNKRR